ncbi:TPR-like protein [Xylariaceae sp. FL1019]|nr:TPR-like protein [Xylariaceae sp. FL1019]
MYAKFSLIYAQCGQVQSAESLMDEVVKEQDMRNLQLSKLWWEPGKTEEALDLLNDIAKTCERYFGRKHPETLRALHQYSKTLWQQVDGLTELLGREHGDTLEALSDLGLTVGRFWRLEDLEKSSRLHFEALEGMIKTLGPEHLRGTALLHETLQLIDEVIEIRKARMGKEAGWTLFAIGTKATVLSALGRLDEAEEIMRHIIPIATLNAGPNHIAGLFGRQVLSTILIEQGRFKEAERFLLEIAEAQKTMSSRRGNYHPDRIASLIELARCYQLQGKLQESIAICDETIQGLEEISETRHAFTEMLMLAKDQMLELGEPGSPLSFSSAPVVIKFPEHLFKLYT